MEKIAVVSYSSIYDVKNRSGTGYFLPKFLSEKYEVIDVPVEDDFFSLFLKSVGRFFGRKKTNLYFLYLQVKLMRKIKTLKKEKIHYFLCIACSPLIKRNIFGNSKIIYLTDSTIEQMQNYYRHFSKKDYQLLENLEKQAIYDCDACIVSSDWCENSVVSHYFKDKNRVFNITFPSYFDDEFGEHKIKIYDKKEFYALLVGVDYERKGVDTAIKTIELLNKNNYGFKFHLNIVGVQNIKKYSSDYIKFIGRLNKNNSDELKQLINLYCISDFFLLPTKAECSAIVFSEACMYALPIFSSNTGGVGSYVIDDYNGWKTEINSFQENELAQKIIESVLTGKIHEYSVNSREHYAKFLNKNYWLSKFEIVIDFLKNDR